jgi:soluble lytic murein transglycosylase-like protein
MVPYLKAMLRNIARLLLFLLILTGTATAGDSSSEIRTCFKQAAEHHNIPVELLLAVAEVESGLAPYALNHSGAAILPSSRSNAEQLLAKLSGQRGTFDIGIMQVNRWWFEKYGEPYGKGLDVCFNIDFGARILAMAIKDNGFTWEAVGRYHSPTSWRKEAYARKIFTRLERLLAKKRELPVTEPLRPEEERLVASRKVD